MSRKLHPAAAICMLLSIFLSAVNYAATDHRLAYSKKLGIEVLAVSDSENWCQYNVSLQLKAEDQGFFQSSNLQNLFSKIGKVVEQECPSAVTAEVTGYAKARPGSVVYSAVSGKESDWVLAPSNTTAQCGDVSHQDEPQHIPPKTEPSNKHDDDNSPPTITASRESPSTNLASAKSAEQHTARQEDLKAANLKTSTSPVSQCNDVLRTPWSRVTQELKQRSGTPNWGPGWDAYLKQDYETAYILWKKAETAEPNSSTGWVNDDLRLTKNNLGVLYERGQGVGKDLSKASELYKNAATTQSYFNLGRLYESGCGVQRNLSKAIQLYYLSTPHAQKYGERAMNKPPSGFQDLVTSSEFNLKAGGLPSHEAGYRLARIIEENKLLPLDTYSLARLYYIHASPPPNGDKKARERIKQILDSINTIEVHSKVGRKTRSVFLTRLTGGQTSESYWQAMDLLSLCGDLSQINARVKNKKYLAAHPEEYPPASNKLYVVVDNIEPMKNADTFSKNLIQNAGNIFSKNCPEQMKNLAAVDLPIEVAVVASPVNENLSKPLATGKLIGETLHLMAFSDKGIAKLVAQEKRESARAQAAQAAEKARLEQEKKDQERVALGALKLSEIQERLSQNKAGFQLEFLEKPLITGGFVSFTNLLVGGEAKALEKNEDRLLRIDIYHEKSQSIYEANSGAACIVKGAKNIEKALTLNDGMAILIRGPVLKVEGRKPVLFPCEAAQQ